MYSIIGHKDKKKEAVCVQWRLKVLKVFSTHLVESTYSDPADTENWRCICYQTIPISLGILQTKSVYWSHGSYAVCSGFPS